MLSVRRVFNGFFVLLLVLVVSASSFATGKKYPKSLTLSHINHPVTINDLIPLLERTYQKLNIETKFVMQPSARNLRVVSMGLADGDVAYSDLLFADNPDLIRVPPNLLKSIFVLLCAPGAECNAQVLFDKEHLVAITQSSQFGVETWYNAPLGAAHYRINDLSSIPRLITDGRLQYGVYVFGEHQVLSDEIKALGIERLFTTDTYHTLHKKFAHIRDDVSRALTEAMAETGMP
jgi:hypothetical protein